ncbi:hypothetical protein OYE22_19105 [Streptomyces sp. 71268]|uniref:hypothetical protein n=1 Tax=Streptomyces sp. 71268 TaxID=3002640 RepID=UPI0023F74175|nr:hypothetical protein [Streptomyces sp. 71268]WEV27069.1 hypothetical protein OYE22_19105 [Streptomyces sp. 71268]
MNDLDWTPPPCDRLTVLPAGRQWDAVRTDIGTARWAFGFLDAIERSAAIVDAYTGSVHWLVPPGEVARAPYDDWERLRGPRSGVSRGRRQPGAVLLRPG